MNGYIIFSDLKGFSKLSSPEIRLFYKDVLPRLFEKIHTYRDKSKIWNTWGDAIVAIFEDGKDAVDMMLAYRDFFLDARNNTTSQSKNVLPRIAGHFGEFDTFEDPILGGVNMLGSNINATARIEPITRAGEVFVTKQFKDAIEALPEALSHVKFDELGIIPLAKNFGERELYRLYRNTEKPRIIDKILKQDLSLALPDAPTMLKEEKDAIEFFIKAPNAKVFKGLLENETIEGKSGEFIFQLAQLSKKFGLYSEALGYIEAAESCYLEVDNIKVYPYKYKQSLIKLKANCLTRIGDFGSAADLVYGLWQSGLQDSDTLSMLAAQYKRRAIFKDGELLKKSQINLELLIRAKSIYIEAFRLNIEDYYPAINTAYLYKIIGGQDMGKGNKLARYIYDSWGNSAGGNWWLDCTLAECELLEDDFEEAYIKMKEAVERHKPDCFERKATYEQVMLYSTLQGLDNECSEILKLLYVEE